MWNRRSHPARSVRTAISPWCRIAIGLVGLVPLATGSAASAAEVAVRVLGVTPSPTRVYVSLCTGGLQPENCGVSDVVDADSPEVAVRFSDVAPDTYAVAAFQDLNGNGSLDRSPRGLPREPYGFSREAGRTASPRFDQAAFVVDGAVTVTVRLAAPGRR